VPAGAPPNSTVLWAVQSGHEPFTEHKLGGAMGYQHLGREHAEPDMPVKDKEWWWKEERMYEQYVVPLLCQRYRLSSNQHRGAGNFPWGCTSNAHQWSSTFIRIQQWASEFTILATGIMSVSWLSVRKFRQSSNPSLI